MILAAITLVVGFCAGVFVTALLASRRDDDDHRRHHQRVRYTLADQ